MDFKTYRHLKKLVLVVPSFGGFVAEVTRWPRRYGIAMWTRANYEWFYNRIKGGYRYVNLFNDAA